jgi:L-amino acid N-acyltransferase YncA
MNIRPVRLDEILEVSSLWLEMVAEEFEGNKIPNQSLWVDIFSNKLEYNQLFTMLVAENDGVLIGYISGETYSEPTDGLVHGISQSIYVQSKYRNGRVGLNLYHHLAKIFVSQGAQVIEFLCKPDRISFWNKKGYSCHSVVMSMNARNLKAAYETNFILKDIP